ncbi:MAG: hypothetical protein ACTHZ1_07465 [Sphingobacterium sp.]
MRILSFFLLFLAIAPSLFGQTLQEKLRTTTLDSQFILLDLQSRSQDAYFKIIRKGNLDIIRKNISDTIGNYKKEIASLNESASAHTSTVTGLQDSVQRLSSSLTEEQKKTASISFLGINFAKGTYHTMVWVIIFVLAVAFVGTLFAFRKAKVDTVESKAAADELQEELQTVRKKSLEREQQLKRQLLDEQLKRNS